MIRVLFYIGDGWAPAVAGHFEARTIASDLTGGYQVVIADVNGDGEPDMIAVASGQTELVWYENPGWQRHVIALGLHRMINAAAKDIDHDGIPEVAIAYEFSNDARQSLGIVDPGVYVPGKLAGFPIARRRGFRRPPGQGGVSTQFMTELGPLEFKSPRAWVGGVLAGAAVRSISSTRTMELTTWPSTCAYLTLSALAILNQPSACSSF